MRTVDVIQKKRDGLELTSDEIKWLIEGYVAGTVPDYQMSAFAMAVYFKGMSTREISDLTMTMVGTGQQIDLSAISGIKVDKHSTGGVGDKVTLVLVPLVASFGVPVAKMSGRGLGHTGGTLDKLESIKGFQIERSQEEFIKQVQDIGLSVIGQSNQLVKADKLLYALRDVTATVDTIPLIASSVMSKKIAAGADSILLDVTVGEGAFMKNLEDARALARTMVDLGKAVGRKTTAVITDMSQPLGTSIGNRLEILEALDILQGKGRKDVTEFICELGQIMLGLANVEKTVKEVREHLFDGSALQKFEAMVVAQGGDLEDLYRPSSAKYVVEVPADEAGYISELPAMEFGLFAMRLGAGRAVKSDALDFETGIVFEKKVGEPVKIDEIVAKIYANEKISQELVTEFKKNVKISNESKKVQEIIEVIA
ncbi:pyrimidine-nucleoside phosphorylase [Streptococcus constellatus]|uniref:pyrimidine-nucleoside phosphorylase n=1 Tax=Streptococcus constellatus TaxID=76860 RepID=UPI001C579CAE|nr:pyrimidine-nucleoside phosphorylase [Streptococcus constellatus]MBW3452667.1 pyrimidine-nucleoside phosphorylase [Streptococcus constellatus]